MGVNIIVSNQKFLNEFKNDVGFVSNLGDFTNNLAGSVMENIQYNFEVDISWNFIATTSNNISNAVELTSTEIQINKQTGSWTNEGFSVGDTVLLNYTDNAGAQSSTGTISTLSGTVLIITWGGLPIPGNLNGWITESTEIYGTTDLTASVYKFGLIGNSENFNVESKVSGNDQGYYGSNIGFDTGGGVRDTNFVNLQRLGTPKDWVSGNAKIRYVSSTLLNGVPVVQKFQIIHEFTIVPYYLDGELTNLQNNVIPNLLNGLNSLKYVFSPGFRTVLSNPNTEKIITNSNNLGSVAWFNENFNGFQNDYVINNVVYSDAATLASADGLLTTSKTLVTISVDRVSGSFSGAERFGVYASYLPSQTEYENTTLTDLKENFLYDNAINNAGLPPVNGASSISNVQANVIFGTLIISFEVEYTTAQKIRLANQQSNGPIYFLLGIQVGDVTLPSGNSDRVILIADVDEYDSSADIEGLSSVTKFDAYAHNKQIGVDAGSTDSIGWNESGLVWDYNFQLDLSKSAFINSLDFKLLAFDPVSEAFFELDSDSYNIGNTIVSGGVQQLNEQSTRNYILALNDQFNDKTINTGTLVGNLQNYFGRFGQKFKWQDWIQNLGADSAFYDVSKPNNNLNYKTSNYSLLNGYEIRMAILMNLSGVSSQGVSGLTDYLFLSPTLKVYDYEKDGNITPVWTHVIETFNASNGSPLNGAILPGQNTLFRSTWTNSGGPVTTLVDLFVINRIQQTGSIGDDIEELSSINPPPSGQKLIPLTGTLLDVSIVGGLVVAECLIDGSLISSGISYDLSTEIRDDSAIEGGKQKSPSGDIKQKSNTSEPKQKAP